MILHRKFAFLFICILTLIFSFFIFTRFHIGQNLFTYFLPAIEKGKLGIYECSAVQNRSERIDCMKNLAPKLIANYGVGDSMAALDDYVKNAGETFSCHETAHAFGDALYEYEKGDLVKSMGLCSTACHNGCQHAVMGKLFSDEAQRGEIENFLKDANSIVAECAKNNTDSIDYGLCIHGLGHSLMLARNGDLVKSLADCDNLELAGNAKYQCWSGAFMENNSNIMEGGRRPEFFSADDPLFPCKAKGIKEKYLGVCYHQLALPRDKAFDICRGVDPKWSSFCFSGTGSFMAASFTDDPQKTIDYCNGAKGEEIISCLQGGMFGNKVQIRKYCSLLDETTQSKIGCRNI